MPALYPNDANSKRFDTRGATFLLTRKNHGFHAVPLPIAVTHGTLALMRELLQTNDVALLSALKAALASEGIAHVEFDDQIAGLYGGIFARRLMVDDDDLDAANEVLRALSPDDVPKDIQAT